MKHNFYLKPHIKTRQADQGAKARTDAIKLPQRNSSNHKHCQDFLEKTPEGQAIEA